MTAGARTILLAALLLLGTPLVQANVTALVGGTVVNIDGGPALEDAVILVDYQGNHVQAGFDIPNPQSANFRPIVNQIPTASYTAFAIAGRLGCSGPSPASFAP